MSEIILSGDLIKKKQKQTEFRINRTSREGAKLTIKSGKVPGANYYIFKCPACGKRNNRPEKQAKYKAVDKFRLAFRCNGCERIVEIPAEAQPVTRIITL